MPPRSPPRPVGVAGVKAVAKPKPKPKPAATAPDPASGAAARQRLRTARASPAGAAASASTPTPRGSARAVDSVFHLGSHRWLPRQRRRAQHRPGRRLDDLQPVAGRRRRRVGAGHVGEFNVKYVIWRQRYWEPGRLLGAHGGPRLADGEPHGPRARDGQQLTSGPPATAPSEDRSPTGGRSSSHRRDLIVTIPGGRVTFVGLASPGRVLLVDAESCHHRRGRQRTTAWQERGNHSRGPAAHGLLGVKSAPVSRPTSAGQPQPEPDSSPRRH